MKRWFSMMLLVGALLGLFAQEAAFASAIPMQMSGHASTSSPAGMSEDCAKMMELAAHSETGQKPEKPCSGMTIDCVAKMGCASTTALLPDGPIDLEKDVASGEPTPMPVTRLVGRNLGPEPEPPARLG